MSLHPNTTRAAPIELPGTFEDASGREIAFVYEIDFAPPNRGFVEDRVLALHGTERVGYIRAEYFTQASFDAHHPTAFNFADQILGTDLLPFGRETEDPRLGDPEILSGIFRRMRERCGAAEVADAPEDYASLVEALRKDRRTARTLDGFGKALEKELRWRIDFPFVSYVCTRRNPGQGVREDGTGLGIGTELYQRMALTLAGRGLILRSSTLRTEDATRAWTRMADAGWAVVEHGRFRAVPEGMARLPIRPDGRAPG